MIRLLLITLILLSSSPAFAEWVALAENDVYTRYVELDTIRRHGNLVRMWTLDNYKVSEAEAGDLGSSKTQVEYNCAEERSRRIESITFSGKMGRGKEGYIDLEITPWHPISSRIAADRAIWKFACAMK